MNSKILDVLNLIDEKSFKKCEKVIAAGLKTKKNEKLYLLLKCLLHSHVNEMDECKQILETLEVDDSDENVFYILRTIYTNMNEGGKLIHLYEEKIKKAELSKKGLSIINGNVGNVGNIIVSKSNNNNNSSSSNNVKVAQKEKIDVEMIIRNLFDYCLNTSFFKKGSNFSLKLYKQTNDSKYLLYNSYLIYMNNSNNNTLVYNLALNFLKNYKCYSNNKLTENFSFFLVFFFINIKLRNYEECVKILEYAKSNNFFLNPLQYQVYKLYIQFIFNKLDSCIDVLTELIKELPENSDYYILYMDLIIYLLNKHNPDMKVENIFNLYKNDLMYLEFFQKCFIHICIQKVKAFPDNIYTFWNCIEEDGQDRSDGSRGSCSYYKDVMNLVLSMDQMNISTQHDVRDGENDMEGSGADGESGPNDLGSDNSDAESNHHKGRNKHKGRRECHSPIESITKKLDSLIEDYKNDVMKIYKNHDVKVYLYMLLSFMLKESKNYNMFYSIKNHLSLLKDDMIAILIVFIKIILKKLYVAISTEMKALSVGNLPGNELKKEIQKNILLFYKQIYNFEKLLYVLYKKDVHESFNRVFSMFIQVTNNMDLKLRDDNFVVLLVEMALYLDKYNLCQPEEKNSFDQTVAHMHNLVNSRCEELNLGGCKSVDEFLGPIGSYECAVVEGEEGTNGANGKNAQENKPEAYHIPNVQNRYTTIFQMNDEEKNERDIQLTNRAYYIAALSVLKYSYNYRIRMTEKENEEKKVKPIINNDYINVLVLMIYLNNIIGNFTNFSTLIDKLNIKNIQLITYSPILFIHTYSYSYFKYAENLLKNILNYYNVQQGNLKNSISKCFQNNSIFKVNEIVNAYFLNSSNIIFYFIKLLYIFKKQLEAPRGGFHFNIFGSVKKDYAIHNEYCTKFTPVKEISSGRSKSEKPSGQRKSANAEITGAKDDASNSKSKKSHPDNDYDSNSSTNNFPMSNEFFSMLKRLNEDILHEEQDFRSSYSKLMLDKFNFLTIDNQTILIKYNVPSFRFTLYKAYDSFFYNHILYETLPPLEEFQFLKDIKILNTTEANSVNLLKDIKTVYPMILLSNFYNLKGSVYITSHESILDCKNMGDVLGHSDKNVSQARSPECAQSINQVPFDKIKEHARYSIGDHEINFFISNNIYVSFDKDNYNYRNKYIFKSNKPKFQFNDHSLSSPFNICLTELFNYPIQTLYLNAVILNTVMYLFHKSFYYFAVTDEAKKMKMMSKAKCAFLYLTYIFSYYQLTEGLSNGDLLYMQKELDDFTAGVDSSHLKRENDHVKNNENATPNQVTPSAESPTRNDKKAAGKNYIPIDSVFKKKYGQDIFKKYEIMQAAYHNDIYSKNAALHYRSILLNLNMYIRILAGDSNVKDFTDKLQFLDNIIYLNVSNELNVFKQILAKDDSYQIINMSCLFKQYNYLVHNVTIITLIIQSIYNHGRKKISSENNMLIKTYLMRKVALFSDVNKNLLSLSEGLDKYKSLNTSDVLKNFELELVDEIAASCKQHVLNLYNLFNGKMLIIKSYL
ncbi:conserved Plasmodium protein, unknown function [Plasmodium knowlesi strain H]|uniref:Uncharacterized protein n=3 Tax=Plasmodium knowlesi TaxID=5850 RepID=A0A5K1VTP3_PLAKH|nr:conserved Plasmodium protein, unknown function [Plasmodium knowlesi strain H]OTN64408.1 Uncharacterized protein PKNOH_S130190300 [Plasmodium knowlesi]CAA9989066.1 conserved Plasmodium protein, unknown function [Plasmodium knowlesi strain H]SBO27278.1 conserved Plasmodium protein, unknown function [Plasmodium knowlesi strain H]SBO28906.1 conserved Plasmodium protein, unknown function [Plasmodium knowlesi strain H]VVS78540.1 conserved Plasmodium protein, unknown function [Plasmodium knowlesi |eukprot:XP_002261415.1 hypothetical protein, conserved in Plasmodium species [Plasmodium knowlesi strain H]